VAAVRRAVILDPVGVGVTDDPEIARAECLQVIGIRLGDVARRVDLTVRHDERTLAARLRRSRDPDRIEQVDRPVGAESVVGTLSARDDDRLVAAHGEAQEVCGLLERIGSLDEHHAVHVGRAQELIHAHRELAQRFVVRVVPGVARVHPHLGDGGSLG